MNAPAIFSNVRTAIRSAAGKPARFPEVAQQVVRTRIRLADEQRQQLTRRSPAAHWIEQRLDEARAAVYRAQVGPALERVGLWNMPAAERRRLVEPAAHVQAEWHPHDVAREIEVRRLEQHFVYNALNTIAALIRTDPGRARDLLMGFAVIGISWR